jgi:hypothetical protein
MHPPLAPAGGLVRICHAVIQVPVLAMFHAGQELSPGCLIQKPLIARPATSTAQLIGILLAKLAKPFPDRLVGHGHATDEQKFLHISVTGRTGSTATRYG